DVRLRDPVLLREQRVAGRLEPGHHPRMLAAPDEEAHGSAVLADRLGRNPHRVLEAVGADDAIGAAAPDDEARGPAPDRRALAHHPARRRPAPRTCKPPALALGAGRPGAAGLDDVEHHLDARAHALDEVLLL